MYILIINVIQNYTEVPVLVVYFNLDKLGNEENGTKPIHKQVIFFTVEDYFIVKNFTFNPVLGIVKVVLDLIKP